MLTICKNMNLYAAEFFPLSTIILSQESISIHIGHDQPLDQNATIQCSDKSMSTASCRVDIDNTNLDWICLTVAFRSKLRLGL